MMTVRHSPSLSPPPISPIATPSEEQKEHEDNKNQVHNFLQISDGNISPAYVGPGATYRQYELMPACVGRISYFFSASLTTSLTPPMAF